MVQQNLLYVYFLFEDGEAKAFVWRDNDEFAFVLEFLLRACSGVVLGGV